MIKLLNADIGRLCNLGIQTIFVDFINVILEADFLLFCIFFNGTDECFGLFSFQVVQNLFFCFVDAYLVFEIVLVLDHLCGC